mmetsp:Transcript_10785/g.23000  ORF Transcript_10785/g.23000 Transcript_10785/m.23000 type:complete len:281 (+) Transcript_10785:612-1454(+)
MLWFSCHRGRLHEIQGSFLDGFRVFLDARHNVEDSTKDHDGEQHHKIVADVSRGVILEAPNVFVAPAVCKPLATGTNQHDANHVGETPNAKYVGGTGQDLLVGGGAGEGHFIGGADGKYFTKANQNVGRRLPEDVHVFPGALKGGMDFVLDQDCPRHRAGSQTAADRKLVRGGEFDATPRQVRVDGVGRDGTKHQDAERVQTVHAGNIEDAECLGHDGALDDKGCWHLIVSNVKGNHQHGNAENIEQRRLLCTTSTVSLCDGVFGFATSITSATSTAQPR